VKEGNIVPEHEPIHIFDLIFKRLMRLSNRASVQFINGLFDTAYPVDSTVDYPGEHSDYPHDIRHKAGSHKLKQAHCDSFRHFTSSTSFPGSIISLFGASHFSIQ
jgi:hypothetical protein